jgi:hypothetical protein
MRGLIAVLTFAVVGVLLTSGANVAQDKKTDAKAVTLKGKIACAKCELSLEQECLTVIVVAGKDKKDVVYYFDPAAHTKYHDNICSAPSNGSVTGTVKDDGKKKVIVVKSLEFFK